MTRTTNIILCLLLICTVGLAGELSILTVVATYQENDPYLPWLTMKPDLRNGYAVNLGSAGLITTERTVRNAKLIELVPPRSAKKIRARVVASDIFANLALLVAEDEEISKAAVDTADFPKIGSEVSIKQLDENRQVQIAQGTVMHASINPLADYRVTFLTFTLLTDISIGADCAPVLYQNRLAGVVVGYDRSTRTATVVPMQTIATFLENINKTQRSGFAIPGFLWKPLVEPARLKQLGIAEDGKGILVLSALPEMPAAKMLKPNDVILSVNGFPIDSLGFYDDPDLGRILFSYIASGRSRPGDFLNINLIREKKPMEVSYALAEWLDEYPLIPENLAVESDDYIVEGGFLIRELNGRYLKVRGQGRESSSSSRLAYLYRSSANSPETSGQRVIILATVLPDEINVGYQNIREEVVTAVNGSKINNLSDVFSILDRDGNIHKITLKSFGLDVVLDKKTIKEANKRIANAYRIPELRRKKSH